VNYKKELIAYSIFGGLLKIVADKKNFGN